MYLSAQGHEVMVYDSLMRRHFDLENGFDSLVPITTPQERVDSWKEVTGKEIQLRIGDTRDWPALSKAFQEFQPQALVHLGEQRTAPYSMIDREHAIFTMDNNVLGTMNVLYALKDYAPDCHHVKLGTMGEYGTPNIDIEEGFIEIEHNGRRDTLPFPKQPGSFYHLSKVHDSHNIMFACRIWGLRSTDLNQGVVYGIETEETKLDPRLATRFDYDQIYGTALNRFCAQAAVGYPITIHGKGGQTRGFINIMDTVRCIELAILNPPKEGGYQVFNQLTEQFSVLQLAELVQNTAPELGLEVKLEHIENPRVELEDHYFNAVHTRLLDLGLQPHLLQGAVLIGMMQAAIANKARVDQRLIAPTVSWRKTDNAI
jgi:UDP-sulfoquinovose synthase